MLKIMGKKIFTIYAQKFCLSKPLGKYEKKETNNDWKDVIDEVTNNEFYETN